MAFERWPVRLALAAVLLGALSLAACGRKGGLDLPPGAAAATPPPAEAAPSAAAGPPPPGSPQAAAREGFDAYGNPVAPPGRRRSFILDPLLN